MLSTYKCPRYRSALWICRGNYDHGTGRASICNCTSERIQSQLLLSYRHFIIVFKLTIVTYKARLSLSGLPTYLQCEIHDYHLSGTLRSTSALLLRQQPATISFGVRVFCAAAATVWNSLGVHTRSADTFLTFTNRLKTELFKSCYL